MPMAHALEIHSKASYHFKLQLKMKADLDTLSITIYSMTFHDHVTFEDLPSQPAVSHQFCGADADPLALTTGYPGMRVIEMARSFLARSTVTELWAAIHGPCNDSQV